MSDTIHIYFANDKDSLRRIPLKHWENLVFHKKEAKSYPEYAGQKVKYLQVWIRLDKGKPIEIRSIDGFYIVFDKDGLADQQELEKEKRLAVERLSERFFPKETNKSDGNLLDGTSRFNQKRFEGHRWTPSAKIIQVIKDQTFPPKKSKLKLV